MSTVEKIVVCAGAILAGLINYQCGRAVDAMAAPRCELTVVDRTLPHQEVTVSVASAAGEVESLKDCDPRELWELVVKWKKPPMGPAEKH